ncbi:MAG: LCP family protein [Anaerolineales bacterium]
MNKILTIVKNPRYIILAVVALLLFLGSLFGMRAFVRTQQIFQMDGVDIKRGQTATPDTPDLPTPAPLIPPVDLPPSWDGASRINIILLGIDARRDAENPDAALADTVLVVTIDPQSNTAAMFSIPRDTWVNIPGYGYGRINQAHLLGERSRLPGGGPTLAARTVEEFLGIPVHYYARVDFMTFVHLVNYMGGIEVEVHQKVMVDPLGPEQKRQIPRGVHRMDGMIALAYARARGTEGGDVDRARRQQAVLIAMRNKAFAPENFPNLIAKAPEIYGVLQDGINTNMRFEDALRLAVLLQQIPLENIERGVIDYSMALLDMTPEGASVLKPIPDKIRELRDELFTSEGAASPAATGIDLADLVRQENARVVVRNGTFNQGLDQRTANYLQTLGVNVIGFDNATEATTVTRVIDYTGNPYALQFIRTTFGMSAPGQIIVRYDPNSQVDVEIIVGNDWANNNPMP